jgi:molybdopterin converting factor small subunit
MQTRILFFGSLTDVINGSELIFENVIDTNDLVKELNSRYPAFATAKYMMAVDKQTITENTILKEGSTVALLPPFSGG